MTPDAVKEPSSLRVLILAGRPGLGDDGWLLMPLLERIENRGITTQVLCIDRKHEPELFDRAIEKPLLGHRWLRWLSLRHLMGDDQLIRPDLIHVVHDEMAEVAISLAEYWQIPYAISIDDYDIVDRGLRISSSWCRSLIVASPDLARILQDEMRVPDYLLTVIPPGIAAPDGFDRPLDWNRIPVIGSAGRSMESSGFHIFFEAARAVLAEGRDAEFMVALQGEDDLDIRRLAQRMGIGDRVTVADFSLIGPRFWTVLDLYCQTSLGPNVGRTLGLAMIHHVPCIASRVAGHCELIHDGQTGLIVPRGEPFPLAQAILNLLDDRSTSRELTRSAFESIRERFDPESEAMHLTKLYREITHSTSNQPR